MNKETLKYLLEDLHKNELSKVGKINLEKYIIGLNKGIDELIEKYQKELENVEYGMTLYNLDENPEDMKDYYILVYKLKEYKQFMQELKSLKNN